MKVLRWLGIALAALVGVALVGGGGEPGPDDVWFFRFAPRAA